MKRASIGFFLLAGLIGLTDCRSAPSGPAPDLILHNGRIWTGESERPRAQAVAITGERIAAVGSDSEVLARRGPETRIVDLAGRFAVPGFNDNHVHFASAAQFLEFNVMRTASQEEFRERLRDVVARLPPGEWIVGGYWGAYDAWAPGSAGGGGRESFAPDIAAVEELTREHPMFLRKFDDSEFAANRAALEAAGLNAENPQAPGVEFLRSSSGRFIGRMRGKAATELFGKLVPRTFSRARRIEATRRALAEIARQGVTNVSDMSDDEQLEIYRELRRRGELTVRVHFRYPLDRWQELAQKGIRVGSGDEWIRLGALKGHIDGIMGTSTARFFEAYAHDPGNRGRWRPLMVDEKGELVAGKFLGYMLGADAAGLQLTVHAIGDEANSVLLDYLEELDRRNGRRDRRFRLVHAQVVAPKDFPRFGALRVVAEVQPFHLSDDMRWMEERIGRERCRGAYAFRKLREAGAVLSFGTDWPGTSAAEYPINPMLGIYAAVTRQTVTGQPEGGWFPEERISVEEALRAYTWGTAYANFEETSKGTIAAGKVADLAVLSRDLLSAAPRAILDTEVVMTVAGGRIVFAR